MTTELAIRQAPQELALSPEAFQQAIEQAQKKAAILADIVERQHLYAVISGKKHLEVEAWVTIGQAYRYTAEIEWTHPVEGGGWEARAIVKDPTGQQVGAAEAECGTTGDDTWSERASNVQRSMAQTRAISKALRTRLSWVVVLAGYSATPAEEMPRDMQSTPANRPAQPAQGQEQMYACPEHPGEHWKQFRNGGWGHVIKGTTPTRFCNPPKGWKPQQAVQPAQAQVIDGQAAMMPKDDGPHPAETAQAGQAS